MRPDREGDEPPSRPGFSPPSPLSDIPINPNPWFLFGAIVPSLMALYPESGRQKGIRVSGQGHHGSEVPERHSPTRAML